MDADRLVKRLHQFLLAGDCATPELRRLGWFDFVRFDRPETDDPRTMAAAAVHRLLVDADGAQIQHDDRIV